MFGMIFKPQNKSLRHFLSFQNKLPLLPLKTYVTHHRRTPHTSHHTPHTTDHRRKRTPANEGPATAHTDHTHTHTSSKPQPAPTTHPHKHTHTHQNARKALPHPRRHERTTHTPTQTTQAHAPRRNTHTDGDHNQGRWGHAHKQHGQEKRKTPPTTTTLPGRDGKPTTANHTAKWGAGRKRPTEEAGEGPNLRGLGPPSVTVSAPPEHTE